MTMDCHTMQALTPSPRPATRAAFPSALRRMARVCLGLIAAPLALLSAHADSPAPVADAEARKFLESGTEVVVACEPNYPPFVFTDDAGRPIGYSLDLFKLAASKVGLRYRLKTGHSWEELLAMGKRGEVDVFPCLWLSEEREAYLRFIRPAYAEHTLGIAVRKDDKSPPTRTRMRAKVIVQVKDYAFNAKWRKDHPDARYLDAESPGEALKLVAFGKADGYVDGIGTISHLSEKLGIRNLRISDEFSREGSAYHMAVSLRHPPLHAILTEALSRVTPEERKTLEERWLRTAPSPGEILRPYLVPAAIIAVAIAVVLTLLAVWNRRLAREISLRRLAENESVQARRAAEEANRLKSEFLANMSHEIRTPLNAILGYAQLMRADAALPGETRSRVETINRAGEHLLSLINDILEMSKIEAGRLCANREPFDLHALLHDIVDLYRARARAKGLDLELDLSPDLPRHLCTDRAKLRQTLLNLVSNAVKFTDAGSVRISACVSAAREGEYELAISVRDTGPGIRADDLAKLFRPFVKSSAGRSHGGTGLGLAIGRRYAALLGGDITASSTPGDGATFRLTLLAAPAAPPAGDTPQALITPRDTPSAPLPMSALDELPPGLRLELENACRAADYEALMDICDRIAVLKPDLAPPLRTLISAFDYETISRALHSGQP